MSTAAMDLGTPLDSEPGRLRRAWRVLRHRFALVVTLAFLVILATAALVPQPLAPLTWWRPGRGSSFVWLTPYLLSDPNTIQFWTRALQAALPTMTIGTAGAAMALAIGVPVGVLASLRGFAYVGRPLFAALHVLETFPALIIAIALMAVLGSLELVFAGESVAHDARLVLVLALVCAPRVARIVRESIGQARAEPHIGAERAVGASSLRVAMHSLVRRCGRPVAVCAVMLIGTAILLETSLSFLGIGTQPPGSTWGGMLAVGRRAMLAGQWRAVIVPAVLILMTVCAFRYLAHVLRLHLGLRGAP